MGKRWKMVRCSTAMPAECRLDSLPDEILIHILSFLPFKDASKAALLARRWRFLSLYLTNLDFQPAERFMPCVHERGTKGVEAFWRTSCISYVDWVDRVVCGVRHRQLSNNALHCFRICYFLDESFSQKVESWLRFSFDRGVEVLELDCCFDNDNDMDLCRFPSFVIQQPDLFPKLKLLKSLSLFSVDIDNDKLTHLLLSCEFLERLRLCGIRSLTKVNITGDVSRLKYIDLSGCNLVGYITISAPTPDLLSLRYSSYLPLGHCSYTQVMHIEHAPLLEDLFISQYGSILSLPNHRLWRFTCQLKSLHLNIRGLLWDGLGNLPDLRLRCLQHLKIRLDCLYGSDQSLLQWNLLGLITLIKAAPNIRCLTLLVINGISEELKILKVFDDLDLKFLRMIEYVSFCRRKDRKLAMHLTNVFSSLEKLIIDCRPESIRMVCPSYHIAMREIKEWKRSVSKLKKGIRAGVELGFLY